MSDQFYVSLGGSRELLLERAVLKREVEAWWKSLGLPSLPAMLCSEEPKAILARHVATARFEDLAFNGLARRAGLLPVWAELAEDRFSRRSSFKRALVHRHVCAGIGRGGGLRLKRDNFLREFETCDGRRLCEIQREDGVGLLDYHHAVQDQFLPNALRCDVSEWMYAGGAVSARAYYVRAMSLYVAHAVLLEDYHGGESGTELDGFTKGVFEPAFEEVRRRFGAAPLIARMPWDPVFAYYPADTTWSTYGFAPEFLFEVSV